MAEKEKQGMRNAFTSTTLYNQLEFIIERKIKEMINTSAVVRIDSCTSQGAQGDAGTVSATPLVSQTDSNGNALPMASIPSMPHARVQGGIAALIIDPVPGDIGVASFCKADSSNVKAGTTESQRPGSLRSFDQADGMLVATVSNRAPEVWIEIKQDKTIIVHAPEGCVIETDKKVEIHAAEEIVLDTPLTTITGHLSTTGERGNSITMRGHINLQGSMTSTEDQVAAGISQINHVHIGVQPGSGTTGVPEG